MLIGRVEWTARSQSPVVFPSSVLLRGLLRDLGDSVVNPFCLRLCRVGIWSMLAGTRAMFVLFPLLMALAVLGGCQPDPPPAETSSAEPSPKMPAAAARMRTQADRMATRFLPIPRDITRPPDIVEIPLPDFPGRDAIWGATGRDDRGHVWLGVAAGGVPQPSAHLLEYIPQHNEVFDRGSVVEQLKRVRPLAADESQMKIHSKIHPADDGFLYFASMDETGEHSDGSSYPIWGGHLWRMKPFASEWEHLLSTKEALIAVGGSGRWDQFDTQTQKVRQRKVGSVGGHISRNFLVDLNGHAYVPRVHRPQEDSTNSTPLVAELVEWDEQLEELQAVPIPGYEPTPDFESHGIVGWTFLADGDLLFTTSSGGLWRVHPKQGAAAEITLLGNFHPEGRSYPSALYSFAGTQYACGIVRNAQGAYQWVIYDLQWHSSRAVELNQTPFTRHGNMALYGSNTRDNEGNGYLVGRGDDGPVCFKIVFPK
jgi:hypothetical protein